tara:strand:+ start:937 stop:1947 length:1011 start_codon:yes stop_codon:yes gene_type:complete
MKKNNWLEHNYEKVVISVVALICLIFGVKTILSATSFSETFVLTSPAPKSQMPEDESFKMKLSSAILNGSSSWKDQEINIAPGADKEVTLLRSVWIIEHNGKLFDLSNPEEEMLRPPIENTWLIEHKVDFLSRSVLEDDPDGDGYSNLEEWASKTIPVDSESHPPYTDKLMFVQRQQQSFMITFAASNPPDFQINTVSFSGKRDSGFYKIGDSFEKGRFTILSFEEKEAINNVGIKDDVSELTVKDNMTERTFKLVRKVKTNWPTYFAEFNFTLVPEQSKFYVREGQTFTLNLAPTKPYKLLSVSDTEATIQAAGDKPVTLSKGALTAPGNGLDGF